jgi:hypothetical protein
MADSSSPRPKLLQTIDRTAILLILVLSLSIGGLLLKGDRTAPRIRSFNWADRQVGAEDMAFVMAFSRPMEHTSVEQNLTITPPLSGKFSWAGRRMAYTLDTPAPYGTAFEVKLAKARDRFSRSDDARTEMQPFVSQFQTRDRAFVYLGVEGDEAGRLILANLTQKQQKILTPDNLVVMNFEPYPNGDKILFAATERNSQAKGLLDQQLYTVTTGIVPQTPATSILEPDKAAASPAASEKPGEVKLVLDSQVYQNLKFDLSPDGQTIAVQRVKRDDPGDYGLWIIQGEASPQKVNADPGGNFLIAPDSQSLAMSQGQGMAILPLATEAQTLDFLPKYGVILSFARDGSAAAMVKFNVNPENPTRSLFLVTNQGVERQLLTTDGSILEAIFDPTKRNLYCLYTRRLPGEVYQEEPYIAAIPLRNATAASPEPAQTDAEGAKVPAKDLERYDLLQLPVQRDIQVSLAPDGLGLLFDQVEASETKQAEPNRIRSREGKAITASQLWFLPLLQDPQGNPVPADPQPLKLAGLRPRWLP